MQGQAQALLLLKARLREAEEKCRRYSLESAAARQLERERDQLTRGLQEANRELDNMKKREEVARRALEGAISREEEARRGQEKARSLEEEARRGLEEAGRREKQIETSLHEVRKVQDETKKRLEMALKGQEESRRSLDEARSIEEKFRRSLDEALKEQHETRKSLELAVRGLEEAKRCLKEAKHSEEEAKRSLHAVLKEKAVLKSEVDQLTSAKQSLECETMQLAARIVKLDAEKKAGSCSICQLLRKKIENLEGERANSAADAEKHTRDLSQLVAQSRSSEVIYEAVINVNRQSSMSERVRIERRESRSFDGLAEPEVRRGRNRSSGQENVERSNLSKQELELATNKVKLSPFFKYFYIKKRRKNSTYSPGEKHTVFTHCSVGTFLKTLKVFRIRIKLNRIF